MRSRSLALAVLALLAGSPALFGQNQATHHAGPVAAKPSKATVLTPAQQIAGAVAAAPQEMREGATVLGYDAGGVLGLLRKGTNDIVCLADDPKDDQFHTACYHKSLEPFMARGRELLAQGVKGSARDSVRNAEIVSGKIKMPAAAALYTLTGPVSSFNPTTGKVSDEAKPLRSIYVPFATAASTGVSEKPSKYLPWIMLPGTAKAHIMIGAHEM